MQARPFIEVWPQSADESPASAGSGRAAVARVLFVGFASGCAVVGAAVAPAASRRV